MEILKMSDRQIDFKVLNCIDMTGKTGKRYYKLSLMDSSGKRREGRIWDDVIDLLTLPPAVGQYWFNVKSRPNVFQGVEQVVILDFSVAFIVSAEEKQQFQDKSVIDTDRVLDRMFNWPFWDAPMRSMMDGIVASLKHDGLFDKLRSIPAGASYHHSVRGGFLLHIDELLNFSEGLCRVSTWGESICTIGGRDPSKDIVRVDGIQHYDGLIDYQILRAAIVLHDIGKVYDYDIENLQFQSNPVSECLEHTIVGILLIDRYWKVDSPENFDRGLRLKHAIASHHGKEMGAVVPKTPEAILLHHLDMISASLDVCRTAYTTKKNGGQVEYSKMLGARPATPEFFPPVGPVTFCPEKKSAPDAQVHTTPKLPWE
jgi:hypothetical protein